MKMHLAEQSQSTVELFQKTPPTNHHLQSEGMLETSSDTVHLIVISQNQHRSQFPTTPR